MSDKVSIDLTLSELRMICTALGQKADADYELGVVKESMKKIKSARKHFELSQKLRIRRDAEMFKQGTNQCAEQ